MAKPRWLATPEARRGTIQTTTPTVELRAQVFGVVAGIGAGVALAEAMLDALDGIIGWPVFACVLLAALIGAMLVLTRRTGRTQLAYTITALGMCLFAFPFLFFVAGGLNSGMTAFFVFGISFTIAMVDGPIMRILVALELAVCIACIVLAQVKPDLVTAIDEDAAVIANTVFAIVTCSMAIGIVARLLLTLHERGRSLLQEKNAELERIDRARAEFLATVAHELNTPLAIIRAQAQEGERSLADGEVGGLVSANLAVVIREADRLGLFVSQLLDTTRMDEDKMTFDFRPESLTEIVQETLGAYCPLFTQNGTTVQIARGGASPFVLIDRERVAQVLLNLLSNAARHAPGGVVTVSIEVSQAMATLEVRDNGEGIAPSQLARLFDRSAPRPATRTARDAGLGLGLIISHHIVTRHGGTMTVASTLGEGTSVRITLPLAG